MSGLNEYLVIKEILGQDESLRKELKEIWDTYISVFNASDFNFFTLIEAIYTFQESIIDFNHMVHEFVQLPEQHELINLLESRPPSDSINRNKGETL